jgi:hypothetical protein
MKQPVDHIERPRLPWRSPADPSITECGYDASTVKTLTRAEFLDRFKEYGEQRTALFTCMTCMQTARRWCEWEQDPRRAVQREVEWECNAWGGEKKKRGQRLKDELLAIQQLIELHQDEFARILEQQRWRERKGRKPKTAPQRRTTIYDGL